MAQIDWKDFFESSNIEIWTVIDELLSIAAREHPEGLRERRDSFAEKLFAPPETWKDEENGIETEAEQKSTLCIETEINEEPEAGEKSLCNEEMQKEETLKRENEMDTITDQFEDESSLKQQLIDLGTLLSKPGVKEKDAVDVLKKIQQLPVTVPLLQATMVGKVVNKFKKRAPKHLSLECEKILKVWKEMADEWALSGNVSAESDKPEFKFHDKVPLERAHKFLPSPPMDVAVFMDDFPDLQADEFLKELETLGDDFSVKKAENKQISTVGDKEPSSEKKPVETICRSSPADNSAVTKTVQKRSSQEFSGFPNSRNSEEAKRLKAPGAKLVNFGNRNQPRTPENELGSSTAKISPPNEIKNETGDYASESPERFNEAARRLRERYVEIEEAKKQRRIQVLEPKLGKKVTSKKPSGSMQRIMKTMKNLRK